MALLRAVRCYLVRPALCLTALCVIRAGTALAQVAPAPGGPEEPRIAIDLGTLTLEGDHYTARLAGGGSARLSLVPALQEGAHRILDDNAVPFGAAVVVSIPDGKVLALAGRAAGAPRLGPADLALKAWAPAASIFKVVSAAALLGKGLTPESQTCFHGGLRGVEREHLRDDPKLDSQCESLALSVGRSQNAVLAKLAVQHLDVASLTRTARDFGFGTRIPFVADVEPSMIDLPADELEFGRAAAGFYHSTLSPLHGALIAATIANGGLMPRPLLVEAATGKDGKPRAIPARRARRVLDEAQAAQVAVMLEATVRAGTGKSAFHDSRGRAFLPFPIAGKTGSLNYRGRLGDPPLPADDGKTDYLQYSWFVGYAPADRPEIAFATLVGNPAKWRIKGTYLARRLVEIWHSGKQVAERGATEKKTARAAAHALPSAAADETTELAQR